MELRSQLPAAWNAAETAKLRGCIEAEGPGCWDQKAKRLFGGNRSAKSLEAQYYRAIRPALLQQHEQEEEQGKVIKKEKQGAQVAVAVAAEAAAAAAEAEADEAEAAVAKKEAAEAEASAAAVAAAAAAAAAARARGYAAAKMQAEEQEQEQEQEQRRQRSHATIRPTKRHKQLADSPGRAAAIAAATTVLAEVEAVAMDQHLHSPCHSSSSPTVATSNPMSPSSSQLHAGDTTAAVVRNLERGRGWQQQQQQQQMQQQQMQSANSSTASEVAAVLAAEGVDDGAGLGGAADTQQQQQQQRQYAETKMPSSRDCDDQSPPVIAQRGRVAREIKAPAGLWGRGWCPAGRPR